MGGVAAAVGGDAAAAALAGKIEVENNETLGSARLYKFNSAVEASTTVCQQKPTEDRCKNALVQIAKQIKEEGCGRGHTSPTCEALIYQRDIVESTYQTWLNNPKRINNVRQGEVLGSIAMSPFAAISREVTKLFTDDTNTVDGVTVVTAAASNVGAVGVQTAAARGAVVARAETAAVGSAADHIYSSTRPIQEVFPELAGVNPHYVENANMGVNTNCVSCANATQQRLTGQNPNAVAEPSTGRYANENALLPSAPFGFPRQTTTVAAVQQEMLQAGNGAVGIVIIQQGAINHVINTVNRNGQVYFIDSQLGRIVTLQPNVPVKLGRP